MVPRIRPIFEMPSTEDKAPLAEEELPPAEEEGEEEALCESIDATRRKGQKIVMDVDQIGTELYTTSVGSHGSSASAFDGVTSLQNFDETKRTSPAMPLEILAAHGSVKLTAGRCFTGVAPSHSTIDEDLVSERITSILDVESGDANPATLKEISSRGFTLGSLLEFLCVLLDWSRARKEIAGLEEAMTSFGAVSPDDIDLSWFDPDVSQMWEVAYRVVVPLSSHRESAYSRIMTGGKQCYPKRIISHSWANLFTHTVAACVAGVSGVQFFYHILPYLRTYDDIRKLMQNLGSEIMSATIWICAFSINQHTIGCDKSKWKCNCGLPKIVSGPLSEIGCFDIMMRFLSLLHTDFGQIVALDKDCEIDIELNAVSASACNGFVVDWETKCVLSIQGGGILEKATRQLVVGDCIQKVNGKRDVLSMKKELRKRYGVIEITIKRVLSVVNRIWVVAEIAEAHRRGIQQLPISHFPLRRSGSQYMMRIRAADVMKSEATEASDRELILKRIKDLGSVEEYNSKVKEALLKAPFEWRCYLGTVCSFMCCGYFGVHTAKEWGHVVWQRTAATLSALILCLIFAHAGIFLVGPLYWMLPLLNDHRLAANIRKQRHAEIEAYCRQLPWYGGKLWYMIGFFSPLLSRRCLAQLVSFCVPAACVTFFLAWSQIDGCQTQNKPIAGLTCEDTRAYVIACGLGGMGVCSLCICLAECQSSLAGRPFRILFLCALSLFSPGGSYLQRKWLAGIMLQASFLTGCVVIVRNSVLSESARKHNPI